MGGRQKLVCILYNFYNCLFTEHGQIQSYDEKGRSKCYYSHLSYVNNAKDTDRGGEVKSMYVSYITFITSAYKACSV